MNTYYKMKLMRELKFALKNTFAIFLTYLFIGISYGILMNNAGYGIFLSAFSGLFIYAGSMQIVMVPMMTSGASLLSLALMTLFVNGRHLFYGIGFIERFRSMGWRRPYMILSLTDETYSVLCSAKFEDGMDENRAMFLIALMNHIYWIAGCIIGACMGEFFNFDMAGIDFSATAFFLVVVVNQWQSHKSKIPFIIAAASVVLFYLTLGADQFLIPALTICLVLLLLLEKRIEAKEVCE